MYVGSQRKLLFLFHSYENRSGGMAVALEVYEDMALPRTGKRAMSAIMMGESSLVLLTNSFLLFLLSQRSRTIVLHLPQQEMTPRCSLTDYILIRIMQVCESAGNGLQLLPEECLGCTVS